MTIHHGHDVDITPAREEPLLGLATNEEMLRELICRFKLDGTIGADVSSLLNVERALTLAEMLGAMSAPEREYRTVRSS